ncbi:hypothetical protein SALBM311S_09841 [Streptomyces alboniger]
MGGHDPVAPAATATIERLEARIVEQDAENAELKQRLAADSRNSSKPPSSDRLGKRPAPKSLRKASGRRPGRAKGDPGGRLEQVTDPDADAGTVRIRHTGGEQTKGAPPSN